MVSKRCFLESFKYLRYLSLLIHQVFFGFASSSAFGFFFAFFEVLSEEFGIFVLVVGFSGGFFR